MHTGFHISETVDRCSCRSRGAIALPVTRTIATLIEIIFSWPRAFRQKSRYAGVAPFLRFRALSKRSKVCGICPFVRKHRSKRIWLQVSGQCSILHGFAGLGNFRVELRDPVCQLCLLLSPMVVELGQLLRYLPSKPWIQPARDAQQSEDREAVYQTTPKSRPRGIFIIPREPHVMYFTYFT